MPVQKVILLLSGGLDSVVSLAELVAKPVEEVERVHALILDYDQSSQAEVRCATQLCDAWKVPYSVVKLQLMSDTDTHSEIPARNLIFISYAASLAIKYHFNTIAIGFEPDSTYTDSTVEFANRVSQMLDLFDLQLITPVKQLENKLALVVRALELGVPLHLCHSSRSNVVDGKCKTSKLFLDALHVLFPLEPDPTNLLHQLAGLQCKYNADQNSYKIKYQADGADYSFKYAAALFAVTQRVLWDHVVQVYSTGSWMKDLMNVAAKYGKFAFYGFTVTQDMSLLLNQEENAGEWGLKQALSLLPRARYVKGISCRSTQGHLVSALQDLGYRVATANSRNWPHLDTALTKE